MHEREVSGSEARGDADLFAPPRIERRTAADGSILLSSRAELGAYPSSLVAMLRYWADIDPGHTLIAQREGDGWRRRSYGEVLAAADAIGEALLRRGLGPRRPLLILSGNSVEHLLLTLGALSAGVPVAPLSVAYSLQSRDHRRLTDIAEMLRPGAVFADNAARYGPALAALPGLPAIVATGPGDERTEHLGALLDTAPGDRLAEAFEAVGPDSVAKILFTSGSTGTPKGVLNTHRMLCSNQQAMRQVWPFLRTERPVLADWLPWSHTFGGNHNLNMVLAGGGTLHIDDGRPDPAGIARTIENLRDVRPTVCFNVPAGWARLAPALEEDREFADRFFSRLRLMFNAAAALPATLRTRLESVARAVTGRDIPVTMSWGATETAPGVTNAHFRFRDARCIGVPLPGAELRLVPDEDAYEIRVRGPMVTPGYLGRPEETAAAFDERGYYRSGDAVEPADPSDPNAGLLFRGRTAEDFKLATGTFVRVGAVRTALLSAAPVLSDAVIVGENRAQVCALAWLNDTEVAALFGGLPPAHGAVVRHPGLAAHLAGVLAGLNADAGSARRVERLLLLAQRPDLDSGEITDKGYVNQRRVIARRAAQVELLYRDGPTPGVITAEAALPTASTAG